MRLRGEEVLAIRLVIQSLLPQELDLRRFTRERLDKNLDAFTEGTMETRCSTMVAKADADGWLDNLFEALQAEFPHSPELKAVIAATPAAGDSGVDHYRACYFRRRPFVDREHLRGALRSMTSDEGARILLVDGPPVSGRSYTVNLVHHLSSAHRFGVVYIDLIAYGGRVITPMDLGEAIALQMNLLMPTLPEQEQLSRWTIWYCDWFVGQVRTKESWWIVFDSFDHVSLSPDALDLIAQLSRHIDGALNNVRLVLLSFKDVLPTAVEPSVERETVERIEHTHLTEFFIQFLLENGRASDEKLGDVVADVVHRILQNVPDDDPRRLVTLGAEVATECRRFLTEKPLTPSPAVRQR